jgi:hypothetical protein
MKKLAYFTVVACTFFLCCRKDPTAPGVDDRKEIKDSVIIKDVKGMVFNTCTDSGLAGIKVFLKMYHRRKLIREFNVISGEGGKYLFKDVEMHSHPDFEQAIFIQSKPGDLAKDFETCGIRGTSMWFKFDEADIFMQPRVVPKFIYIAFYFPRHHVTTASDSIIARFAQNTYHKNVPDYPYSFNAGSTGDRSTSRWGIGNYPSGLYHIVVDKWISGVHTQSRDSIYTRYGDTAAYVLKW